MDDNVTKTPQLPALLVPGFMLSGLFCFGVAVVFMLSSISGHGVDQPFAMLTSLICR
jgi:hypothetical protein